MTKMKSLLGRFAVAASVGVMTMLFVTPVWSQPAEKEKPKAAKDGPEKAKEPAKGAAKDAPREPAKGAAKDAPRAPAKGAAKDAPRAPAKGAAKDAPRAPTKDAAKDAPREPAKGAAKDTPREPAKGAREAAKRAGKDARDVRDFRAENVRSADLGLWFKRATDQGLVVSDVATSGAVAKLGIREGDRIVSVHGQRVVREADFIRFLFAAEVRDRRVEVIVVREGREVVIYVEPVVFIEQLTVVHVEPLEEFGVLLDDRYDDRVVVWKVLPRTPAFYAGIRSGDEIVAFEGQRVTTPGAFAQLVQKVESGVISVEVSRANRVRQIEVELP